MIDCGLNSIDKIENKGQLCQYSKEQLIEMYWNTLQNNRDIMELIISSTDEQLLDYQRQWKWMKKFIEYGCQLTKNNCHCENIHNKYEFDEKGNIVGYKVNL